MVVLQWQIARRRGDGQSSRGNCCTGSAADGDELGSEQVGKGGFQHEFSPSWCEWGGDGGIEQHDCVAFAPEFSRCS
jgi:hypothetical protein